MNETFGEYLKRMREQQGLTLKQLSKLSDISIAQLSRLENGLREEPRQETIKRLAAALESATYVELMAAAGYLEDLNQQEINELKQTSEFKIGEQRQPEHNIKNSNSLDNNEKEFSDSLLEKIKHLAEKHDMDLSDPETLDLMDSALDFIKRMKSK